MTNLDEMITLQQWAEMSTEEKMARIKRNSTDLQIFVDEHKDLELNMHIIDRFLVESHKIAKTRTHYSARTIIEFLRHHSSLEQKESEFKIANALGTPIARITMLFPALNGLFSFATRKQGE